MSTLRSNESKEAEVKRLYEAGWSVIRIANALNISPQGVYWHLERLELPPPTQRNEEAS